MRIHSKYRDYMDSALGYGIDPNLHWVREEKWFYTGELKSKLPEELLEQVNRHSLTITNKHSGRRGVIGFCGKLYPVLEVFGKSFVDKATGLEKNLPSIFIYTLQEFNKFFEEFKFNDERKYGYRKYRHRPALKQELIRFLSFESASDKIFIEMDAPVFSTGLDDLNKDRILDLSWQECRMLGTQITSNPNLGQYQFYKVVDAFQSFQQISMFLGNQLVKHDNPLEIADEHKITEHGFNERSFRNPIRIKDL